MESQDKQDMSKEEIEHKVSKKPLRKFKTNVQESKKIDNIMLGMIKQEMDWREIYYKMQEVYKNLYDKTVTRQSLWKRFSRLMEDIMEDTEKEVVKVRKHRLTRLKEDMEEAYDNYQDTNLSPMLREKWFGTYLSIQAMMDKYYPNALQPKEEQEEFKLSINFKDIETKE